MRYRRDGARCVLQWGATQGTSAYWAAGLLPEQMRPRDGNVYVPGVCVSPQRNGRERVRVLLCLGIDRRGRPAGGGDNEPECLESRGNVVVHLDG